MRIARGAEPNPILDFEGGNPNMATADDVRGGYRNPIKGRDLGIAQ